MSVGEAPRARSETMAALAELSHALAAGLPPAEALDWATRAAAVATSAEAVVLRVLEGDWLRAHAVAADSAALVAELHGSRITVAELPSGLEDELERLPGPVRAAAARIGATAALVVPVELDGVAVGSLELLRTGAPFDADERLAARLAADHAALALRLQRTAAVNGGGADDALELAGDALAAAAPDEDDRAAERIAQLAARAAGAERAWLWAARADGLELLVGPGGERPPAPATAAAVASDPRPHALDVVDAHPVATLQLGEPAVGVLQLRFAAGDLPGEERLAQLDRFAVRAAHALRAGKRVRDVGGELERSRALLEVVGQAISELSLAHTLETAAARVTELLDTPRVAVYLLEDDRLVVGAAEQLSGPHEPVAERLLELALGPERGRGLLGIPDAAAEPRLASGLAAELAETGIEAAVALPLLVGGQVTGLLAAYPPSGRVPSERDSRLLVALGAQLAVAVQNARLHEEVKTTAESEREARAAEQAVARRLQALYEISSSFAESLSLEETLDRMAVTLVEALDVDAAVIRLPDERGVELGARAMHVAEARLAEVARTLLSRPQPLGGATLRRLLRTRRPYTLTAERAKELGGVYALLAPFLAKGSTAALVPIATPAEVLGTLTIVSFEPGRPVGGETVSAALSIAGQAALAIDNARLYQQQKEFADTMQHSLLPPSPPTRPGLELGAVYESSARVDVGGDVYDFLTLADGRLAVVLGDVTGHGVEATADMAMAKYVFRSLAREHSDPAAFLGRANDVVAGEIAPGKFITMVEVIADAERNRLTCGSAGHPAPRLVRPDGTVEAIPVRGLALGIEAGQEYEAAEVAFPPGSSVVVFTDGVVEARRGKELFGVARLDDVLVAERDRPAEAIAEAVLAACRQFAGAELADDCAVVVIARR
jgi:serine phosphatase RsbU (regulator of sigma subunit)